VLDVFLAEAAGLGPKLGCLLVQLPPKLAFDEAVVAGFFGALLERASAAIPCEPRHATWFEGSADRALAGLGVARVAADPSRGRVHWRSSPQASPRRHETAFPPGACSTTQ
jgi:uncharacterized protein YecE (DUF72 family)